MSRARGILAWVRGRETHSPEPYRRAIDYRCPGLPYRSQWDTLPYDYRLAFVPRVRVPIEATSFVIFDVAPRRETLMYVANYLRKLGVASDNGSTALPQLHCCCYRTCKEVVFRVRLWRQHRRTVIEFHRVRGNRNSFYKLFRQIAMDF